MEKKLLLNAFLISPLVALYGVAPFYVYNAVSISSFILFYSSVLIATLILWGIHSFLAIKFIKLNAVIKILIAQIFMFLMRSPLHNYFNDFNATIPLQRLNSQMVFLFSILPNVMILILCNSIVNSYKKEIAERQIQQLKLENSEAQKQVLVQQLQPHFLFNSLSVLKSLITTNKKNAEEYVLLLSHFLQYSVKSTSEDIVLLEKELQFTLDYIALQEVRFEGAITWSANIPLNIYGQKLPIFALQTLVENIFKHNQFTTKKPLTFCISYEHEHIIVSNKKNPVKSVERNNIGLTNLSKRYLLICEKNIKIVDSLEEFKVYIPFI